MKLNVEYRSKTQSTLSVMLNLACPKLDSGIQHLLNSHLDVVNLNLLNFDSEVSE